MPETQPGARDERVRRADPQKLAACARLVALPHAETVVAANRAYLTAVGLSADSSGEGEWWSLSCLPSTRIRTRPQWRRQSAVNVRTMEVFVLNVDAGSHHVHGLANVRRSTLAATFGSIATAQRVLGVESITESGYRDPGPDQAQLYGGADALIAALRDERVAEAARELTEPLLAGRTLHWKAHNFQLADAVFGRDPG